VQADGMDPCDLRLARGDAAVRDLVAQRVPLYEYAIRNAVSQHDLETTEGRLAALDAAAPIVANIKDLGLRKRYAVNLDRWLGLMDEDFVLARVNEHSGHGAGRTAQGQARLREPAGSRPRGPAGGGPAAPGGHGTSQGGWRGKAPAGPGAEGGYDLTDPVIQVEREVLKLGVQSPGLCGPVFAALGAAAFTLPVHTVIFELICSHAGWADEEPDATSGGGQPVQAMLAEGGTAWARTLRENAPDARVQALVTELAVEPLRTPGAEGEPDARYVEAVLARVEELAVSRQIAQVKSRLQRTDPVSAQAEYKRMFGDLIGLEQRRKVLIGRASSGL
jgi:DNA primase